MAGAQIVRSRPDRAIGAQRTVACDHRVQPYAGAGILAGAVVQNLLDLAAIAFGNGDVDRELLPGRQMIVQVAEGGEDRRAHVAEGKIIPAHAVEGDADLLHAALEQALVTGARHGAVGGELDVKAFGCGVVDDLVEVVAKQRLSPSADADDGHTHPVQDVDHPFHGPGIQLGETRLGDVAETASEIATVGNGEMSEIRFFG